MKIAILSTTLYKYQGADRVLWQKADHLARQGNEVSIFTFKGNMEPPPNVRLKTIGMPTGFFGERLFHLTLPLNVFKNMKYARMLKEFDIIYTDMYPASWLAYLAKQLYDKKYIYYCHHIGLPGSILSFIARIYRRIHIFLEICTIKQADSVICVSEFSKNLLHNIYRKKIEVIYNTVDCSRFNPGLDRVKIRDKYGLGNQPVILFIGQLYPHKGLHLLIDAFHYVKATIPQAYLIIVGKAVYPGYEKTLRRIADNNVIFAGEVSDEELPYYYAACDVYATATLWEGFNIPLVEAQACGKPVVAFDTGPHPEVVDDGRTGILVPQGDTVSLSSAIIKLLQDRELKDMMGNQGAVIVRKRFCSNQAQ